MPLDVAREPDRPAEVVLERDAQPRVAPPVRWPSGAVTIANGGRAGSSPPSRLNGYARLPGQQPRRLARGQRLPLALVLVEHGVRAVASGAAAVDAQRVHALAAPST